MFQPPGFEHSNKALVYRLDKALYGLKQTPRAWFERLTSVLRKFEFVSSRCDSSLFIRITKHHKIFILVYVDDILVTGSSSKEVSSLITALNCHLSLRDLGQVNYFLGVEVKRTKEGWLHLSQTKYIKDLLLKAKMHLAKGVRSPMTPGQKLLSYGSAPMENPQEYRSIIGALQYVTITRPELAFSVHKVCQFMHNPLEDHWKCVRRILRYLSTTATHGLVL